MSQSGRERGEEWWSTGIIEMRPGMIRLRGYEIQDLIGRSVLDRSKAPPATSVQPGW